MTSPAFVNPPAVRAVAIASAAVSVSRASVPSPARATPAQVESLMHRVESLLEALDLPTRDSVSRLMPRMRKIAGRAQLERRDVNMLHGILKELATLFEEPAGRGMPEAGDLDAGSCSSCTRRRSLSTPRCPVLPAPIPS